MTDTGTRRAVALVIGVGNYPNPKIRKLQYAATDASAMADALYDPHLCRFHKDNVKELTDANATRDAIIEHLSVWLPAAAAKAELVFLYFAGHGVMATVGGQQHGYFLPHDADPDNPVARGVDMAFVADCTKDLRADAVVLCLDCCHAGVVVPRGLEDQPDGRGLGIQPAILRPLFSGRKGRFVWTACSESELSYEVPEFKKGLFTHFLLHELKAADTKGVELDTLFNDTVAQVKKFAKDMRVVQTPWKDVTSSGPVYLVEPGRPPPPPPLPPVEEVRQIVQRLATANTPEREQLLRRLTQLIQPPVTDEVVRAAVPAVFAYMADPADSVKPHALRAFQVIGVRRSFETLATLAGQANPPKFVPILDGLLTLKAEPVLVSLLDRLTDDLTGDDLLKAHEVLERKRQSLGLDEIAEWFRQKNSQYQLVESLGPGLFALAYRAEHTVSKMPFVVRVLRPEFARVPDIRKRFMELAKRAIGMNHTNLVKSVDVDRLTGYDVYYAVRGFVDGVTLKGMLAKGHRFTPREVVTALRQVLSALVEVHDHGVSHGGVKPSNVFHGRRERITLGDLTPTPQGFGQEMAKRLAYDYQYIAPEVSLAAPAGPPADIYAVGCLAFELLTGKPPFKENDHFELISLHRREKAPSACGLRPDLGPAADGYLWQLLAKAPADRPNAETALARLDALFDLPPASPRLTPAVVTPVRPATAADQTLARYRPIVSVMSIGKSGFDIDVNSSDDISVARPVAEPAPPLLLEHTAIVLPSNGEEQKEPAGENRSTPTDATATASAREPLMVASNAAYPFLSPTERPGELGRLGRYRVIRLLGQGGMGFVFLAEDDTLRRPVALKVIRPEVAADLTVRERFLREGRAAGVIRSDYVVTIYEFGEVNGVTYLAMEYLKGQTLEDWLTSWQREKQRPVPAAVVLRVATDVLKGLVAAHNQRLLHRDIKPANLWVEAESNRIKLLDFGITRGGAEDREWTSPGQILGTPMYMAPEQAQGNQVDVRADLFSLGVVLYRMLAGQSPFQRGSVIATLYALANENPQPAASFGGIPEDLAGLIDRLLSKNPSDRPESARAALEVVQKIEQQLMASGSVPPTEITETVAPDPQTTPPPPPPPRLGRRRWLFRLVVLALGPAILMWLIQVTGGSAFLAQCLEWIASLLR